MIDPSCLKSFPKYKIFLRSLIDLFYCGLKGGVGFWMPTDGFSIIQQYKDGRVYTSTSIKYTYRVFSYFFFICQRTDVLYVEGQRIRLTRDGDPPRHLDTMTIVIRVIGIVVRVENTKEGGSRRCVVGTTNGRPQRTNQSNRNRSS